MRFFRALVGLLFVVAAFSVAGCLPVSINPILGTATTTVDPRLTGTWTGRFGDGGEAPTYIHMMPQVDGTFTILTVHQEASTGEWGQYSATSAEVNGVGYLNVRLVVSNGKIDDTNFSRFFTLVRYVVSDDKTKLDVFLIDEEKIAAAIEAGEIKGEVKREQFGADVKITAESKELDAFLAKSDPATLFAEHIVEVTRVSPTPVTP
jgi:hypothetical protein